jgi:ABC-type Mn2+/Zn2+ transport system permease subunit
MPPTADRFALAAASYVAGLIASAVTDLPSSAVIVWAMALIGLVVHVTGSHRRSVSG